MNHPDDSPIGFYLDDLFEATRALPPRDARYLLAETEAHLRDSADAAMADGAQSYEAELGALAAFGTVDDLVPRESRRIRMPLRRLAGQVLHSAMLLGAIGAMTVGASGVAAGLIYLIGGANSIVTVPAAALTPQDCARWLSQQAAPNCHQAALSDWAFETVYGRLAVGLAGVLLLIAYRSCKRRWPGNAGLTPMVTDTAAALAFAVAGLWTGRPRRGHHDRVGWPRGRPMAECRTGSTCRNCGLLHETRETHPAGAHSLTGASGFRQFGSASRCSRPFPRVQGTGAGAPGR